MNVGDWRKWLTEELYKRIDEVVSQKSDYKAPYYIQVQLNPEYTGPAAASNDTKDVTFTAKRIYGIRLVLMNNPPILPQLGTMLWKVDNKKGKVTLEYALPADRPHTTEDSDNEGEIARIVAESGYGLPLVFN